MLQEMPFIEVLKEMDLFLFFIKNYLNLKCHYLSIVDFGGGNGKHNEKKIPRTIWSQEQFKFKCQ